MAIIVNPHAPPPFIVQGRVGFDSSVKPWVDGGGMQKMLPTHARLDPLGPMERAYNKNIPHQDLPATLTTPFTAGQGTMRAHHVADHEIQNMVCDFMNGTIDRRTFFDRLGALFLTGWIDVIVTPRIFKIWVQWAGACTNSCHLLLSRAIGQTRVEQARIATALSKSLSSSLANLRVGHGDTDVALGHAIAPRLQRGQVDLIGRFVGLLNGHDFNLPTLSVETSLVSVAWGGHYTAHVPHLAPGHQIVNNVFMGPVGGGNIFISELTPPPHTLATIPTPQYYPGTQGAGGYVLRQTRSTTHAVVAILIVYLLIQLGYFLVSSLGDAFRPREL